MMLSQAVKSPDRARLMDSASLKIRLSIVSGYTEYTPLVKYPFPILKGLQID
jgi:hypothetical protein